MCRIDAAIDGAAEPHRHIGDEGEEPHGGRALGLRCGPDKGDERVHADMLDEPPDHRIGDRRCDIERRHGQENVVDAEGEERGRHEPCRPDAIDPAVEEDREPETHAIGTGEKPAEPGAGAMQMAHMVADERIDLIEGDHVDESREEHERDVLDRERLSIRHRARCRRRRRPRQEADAEDHHGGKCCDDDEGAAPAREIGDEGRKGNARHHGDRPAGDHAPHGTRTHMVGRQVGGERVGSGNDDAGSDAGHELAGDQEAPVDGGRAQAKARGHHGEGDLYRPALGPLAEPGRCEQRRERHAHAIGAGRDADLDRACRQRLGDIRHEGRKHQRLDAHGRNPRHQQQEMALKRLIAGDGCHGLP